MYKDSPDTYQDQGDDVHGYEDAVPGKGCNCFRIFSFQWWQKDDKERKYLLQQKGEYRESWWTEELKKVKELSEILAGPKWKNLRRKIAGYCRRHKTQKNRFQYDPYSYALNFDQGDNEVDGLLLDFSARFAAPSADQRPQTTNPL